MIPIVSVIMSAYNAEKYISQSIESVLSQTYKNLELIIVNDGSVDNTLQIIEEYEKKDNRIRLINNSENLFVIKSRNIGLREAKGKYISILDSDDLIFPDKLEKQVSYLENNSEVFILGTGVEIIDENGNIIERLQVAQSYEEVKEKIIKNNIIYHSSILFRNENIKYREKMFYCEDYDLFLNAISNKKIIHNLKDILLKYRVLDNSLSRNKNYLIQWLFINKAREFYKEREKNKIDSYDNFDPEEFLKINDINYPLNKKDFYYSFKFCFHMIDLNELRFLLAKYRKYHSISTYFLFYSIISKSEYAFNLLHKIYKKK